MRFVYGMSIEGRAAKISGRFIRVERNKLNPIGGGNFVSIVYYETIDHEIIGLVF